MARLRGFDKLREKLPAYHGKRIVLLPIGMLVMGLLAYCLLILLDVLPRLLPGNPVLRSLEPVLPIIGSFIVAFVALRLIASLWTRRDEMKKKYGPLAYQRMFPRGLVGVFLVPVLVFHAFTPVSSLPPGTPVNELTETMSTPVLALLGVDVVIDVGLRLVLTGLLLVLGILTIRSALLTFGVDYMTVVYLYFPEESQIQNHEIYSVMRHPAYFAVVVLGAAGLTSRMSVYSILVFALIYALLRLHIRREEAELINRFGKSYEEYREKVPRLHVRVKDVRAFLRFLLVRTDGRK
jgi:protein-S-isoprenylcysteine O-methyltransferase Ste14